MHVVSPPCTYVQVCLKPIFAPVLHLLQLVCVMNVCGNRPVSGTFYDLVNLTEALALEPKDPNDPTQVSVPFPPHLIASVLHHSCCPLTSSRSAELFRLADPGLTGQWLRYRNLVTLKSTLICCRLRTFQTSSHLKLSSCGAVADL